MTAKAQELGWPMMGRMWAVLQGVNAEVEAELEGLGIHSKQFFLMAGLTRDSTPSDLARLLTVPPSTITYLVKQLEALGFVRRKIDTGDLRQIILSLTPAGRKIEARAEAIMNRAFGARLSALTCEEVTLLGAILDKLQTPPAQP